MPRKIDPLLCGEEYGPRRDVGMYAGIGANLMADGVEHRLEVPVQSCRPQLNIIIGIDGDAETARSYSSRTRARSSAEKKFLTTVNPPCIRFVKSSFMASSQHLDLLFVKASEKISYAAGSVER